LKDLTWATRVTVHCARSHIAEVTVDVFSLAEERVDARDEPAHDEGEGRLLRRSISNSARQDSRGRRVAGSFA
jgi:hypothetical protein